MKSMIQLLNVASNSNWKYRLSSTSEYRSGLHMPYMSVRLCLPILFSEDVDVKLVKDVEVKIERGTKLI